MGLMADKKAALQDLTTEVTDEVLGLDARSSPLRGTKGPLVKVAERAERKGDSQNSL